MEQELVSVIIPIYNVEEYLEQCLQSVCMQTYTTLDIILVDDGSNDKSLDIAKQYAQNDERIFIIQKPNGGLSSARNIGLEFIKGSPLREYYGNKSLKGIVSFSQSNSFCEETKMIEQSELDTFFTQVSHNHICTSLENVNDFIVQELPARFIHFLDSDDYLEESCIELCMKECKKQNLELCAHHFKEYLQDKHSIKEKSNSDLFLKSKRRFYKKGIECLKENQWYQFYFAWQGLFHSAILNRYRLRFLYKIYHEDHFFGTMLFFLAYNIFIIDKALLFYRIRQESIMNSLLKKPRSLNQSLASLSPYFDDYSQLRNYVTVYAFSLTAYHLRLYGEEVGGGYEYFTYRAFQSYADYCLSYNFTNDPLECKKILQTFKKSTKISRICIRVRFAIIKIIKNFYNLKKYDEFF
ncbi:glycosyltransferase family 2 protein [Campylobacter sp. MIT 21-1685]|uniref:glycosyltransferase family 2 protein n=1 Tax=unclassified Campylobacter TaxID=2593542 RepID=UPI00224A8EE1|nr:MULTISPECIES: glycosyltransferase family 2 protein [unclassified Campylobacter]MCX2683691.1 glycosyltransferase family 2 protein [Campylobacter sp. MIT 21-1684]MCX2751976.1 glycosyltransferase family 2 protein [Campylobacter sp. MIT 21-1682]MCX2808162.1 glycosyltransferase family 2 protein [Campylobacter sp. MIT 21-1685]